MIIRLSLIKLVRSINDKISEWYDHNFLTLLKVKEMNSISLFSPFFVLQSSYLYTVTLYCTSLIIITTVCELQSKLDLIL